MKEVEAEATCSLWCRTRGMLMKRVEAEATCSMWCRTRGQLRKVPHGEGDSLKNENSFWYEESLFKNYWDMNCEEKKPGGNLLLVV